MYACAALRLAPWKGLLQMAGEWLPSAVFVLTCWCWPSSPDNNQSVSQKHFLGLFSFRKMKTFFLTFIIMLSVCLLCYPSGCLRAISGLKRVTWELHSLPPPLGLCCLLQYAPFIKWIIIPLVTQGRRVIFIRDIFPQSWDLTKQFLLIFLTSVHLTSFDVPLTLCKPPSLVWTTSFAASTLAVSNLISTYTQGSPCEM